MSAQASVKARDRLRGLYAVTPDETDTERLVDLVAAAIDGGARVIQYRNKTAARALLEDQAARLARLCRARAVPFLINDHLEIALSCGADGVHLGSDDGDITLARAVLGDERLLGVSCYRSTAAALVAQKAGADYVAFGSMFASSTKPLAPTAPLTVFAAARTAGVDLPLAAIGGIGADNLAVLAAAGVDLFAVIGALFTATATTASVSAAARAISALIAAHAISSHSCIPEGTT